MKLKPFGFIYTPRMKDRMTVEIKPREIVFCRDCEEYKDWSDSKVCMRLGSYYGNTKPDDYCSYGVRKDGDV